MAMAKSKCRKYVMLPDGLLPLLLGFSVDEIAEAFLEREYKK